MTSGDDRSNRGIQGRDVHVEADVLAVGDGAKASKVVRAQESTDEALSELQEVVKALLEQDEVHAEIQTELVELRALIAANDENATDEAKHVFRRVVALLEGAGLVLATAGPLVGPLRALARVLGLPFPA